MYTPKKSNTKNSKVKKSLIKSEEALNTLTSCLSSKESKISSTQTSEKKIAYNMNKIYRNLEKNYEKREILLSQKINSPKIKENFFNKTSEITFKEEFFRLKKNLEEKNKKEQIYLRKIVNLDKENKLLRELLKDSEIKNHDMLKKSKLEISKLNKKLDSGKNKKIFVNNKETQVSFNMNESQGNSLQNEKINSYINKLTQKLGEIENASKQILIFDNNKILLNNSNLIDPFKTQIEILENENRFLNNFIERNFLSKIHPKNGFSRLLEVKRIIF